MNMSEVGQLTFGIRDNSLDLVDFWKSHPEQFGEREVDDLCEALLTLQKLLATIQEAATV